MRLVSNIPTVHVWSDVNITAVKTFQPSRNQLEDNPLIVSAAFGRGAVKIAFCILDQRS